MLRKNTSLEIKPEPGKLSREFIQEMDFALETFFRNQKAEADRQIPEERKAIRKQNRELSKEVQQLRAEIKELRKEFMSAAKDGMKQEQARRELTEAYYKELKLSEIMRQELLRIQDQLIILSDQNDELEEDLDDESSALATTREELTEVHENAAQLEESLQQANTTISLLQGHLFIQTQLAQIAELQKQQQYAQMSKQLAEGHSAERLLSDAVKTIKELETQNRILEKVVASSEERVEKYDRELTIERAHSSMSQDALTKRIGALKSLLELEGKERARMTEKLGDANLVKFRLADVRPASLTRGGLFSTSTSIQTDLVPDADLEYKAPRQG